MYFGGMLYGTEEQKQGLAVGLRLTFKLAHNEQWPKSMDELGRWVDTELATTLGMFTSRTGRSSWRLLRQGMGPPLTCMRKVCGV